MKRTNTKVLAIFMIVVALFSMVSNIDFPIFADISPADKLLQNEKLINPQDVSYQYKDIAKHWAKADLYNLSYQEILTGFTDGTMKPDKTVTREEFIAMLVRAINLPLGETSQQAYSDIGETHWSFQYVQAAKAAGLIHVFGESKLNPVKIITREEMAVIAAQVVRDIPQRVQSKSFTDISKSYRYLDSINIVTGLGIIKGTPDGSFKPSGSATRAEAAVIIQRILGVKATQFESELYAVQYFAEDYEKSMMTNPMGGVLSREELLSFAIGKELKQLNIRNGLIDGLVQQGINLSRTMTDLSVNSLELTKYLGEVSLSYKLTLATTDGISKDYKVTRKLYLKKLQNKWLVYNSEASYSEAYSIGNGEKVNLAWQYLSQSTPDMTGTAKIEGLNVISPTWFTLKSAAGEIKSIADVNYSNWAHKNGYQVWGLVTNDFDEVMTSQMLANPSSREKAVNMLIQYAKDYKLDGINVDFENMFTADKNLFTQFVKELYAKTKPMGIILSVDVTVIVSRSNWSECYDRKALAQVSDYIALMAYDQYWSGSPVSGSVSQLKWTEDHLKKVLLEVPKEKLLLGMPFYTRLWKEQLDASSKLVVTSKAVSMDYAEQQITENNATKTWDAVSGQYYATYKKDGATYKIWLEDENSIRLRVELANKYNLAGVASWKLGFEKQGIWNVIAATLNKIIASR